MTAVVVKAMQGIGDQIYSRPFIGRLCAKRSPVYVETAIPELYEDLPVKFLDPGPPNYRTQLKHYNKVLARKIYEELDGPREYVSYGYGRDELKLRGIISHMEYSFNRFLGIEKTSIFLDIDLPHWNKYWMSSQVREFVQELTVGYSRRYAIIRPVTLRREWYCETRSPDPKYVGWCARYLLDSGYEVLSLADTLEGEEWIEGESDLPAGVTKLHHGELGLIETLSLVRGASMVVSGPCFLTPLAIGSEAPLFTIFGGRGEYDNPHKLFDLRLDLQKLGWAIPDNFCRCNRQVHTCDKRITNLDDKFMSFVRTALPKDPRASPSSIMD